MIAINACNTFLECKVSYNMSLGILRTMKECINGNNKLCIQYFSTTITMKNNKGITNVNQ